MLWQTHSHFCAQFKNCYWIDFYCCCCCSRREETNLMRPESSHRIFGHKQNSKFLFTMTMTVTMTEDWQNVTTMAFIHTSILWCRITNGRWWICASGSSYATEWPPLDTPLVSKWPLRFCSDLHGQKFCIFRLCLQVEKKNFPLSYFSSFPIFRVTLNITRW